MTHSTMLFRAMTSRAFAALGVTSMAYVKPVRQGDRRLFEIYGADGTSLGTADDRHEADVALRRHDLEPVSVH